MRSSCAVALIEKIKINFNFATRVVVWHLPKIKVNFNFATRYALSGEFLFAARQKEPKALDRQRSLLRLAASGVSIRYSGSARADSGCRVQSLPESLAKPGRTNPPWFWQKLPSVGIFSGSPFAPPSCGIPTPAAGSRSP